MSLGKQRAFILVIGGTILSTAALGVVWSVVPISGATLPHLIEARSGLSFRLAALFVSLVSALLGVLGMFVFSFYPITTSNE